MVASNTLDSMGFKLNFLTRSKLCQNDIRIHRRSRHSKAFGLPSDRIPNQGVTIHTSVRTHDIFFTFVHRSISRRFHSLS